MNGPLLDEKEYELINPAAVQATRLLMDLYENLGSPKDPFSEAGTKVMTVIIALWQDLYPHESKIWFETRQEYKDNELSVAEQVQQSTGRSIASIPTPIHHLMKKLFSEFKGDKDDYIKLVERFPIFGMASKL